MNLNKELILISDPISSAQIFRAVSADNDVIWTVKTNNRQQHFKFCAICGHKLKNIQSLLKSHYAAQHQFNGQQIEPQFLKIDHQPTDCKYSNWEQYINNPDEIKPKLWEGYQMNNGGRKQIELVPLVMPNPISDRKSHIIVKKQKEFILNKKLIQNKHKILYRKNQTVTREYHLLQIRQHQRKINQLLDGKDIEIPEEYFKYKFQKQIEALEEKHLQKLHKLNYEKNQKNIELQNKINVKDNVIRQMSDESNIQTQMITGLQEKVNQLNANLKEANEKLQKKKSELYEVKLRVQYSKSDDQEQIRILEQLQDFQEAKYKEELEAEKLRRESAEQELKNQYSRFEYHKEQNLILEKQKQNSDLEYKELEKEVENLKKQLSKNHSYIEKNQEALRVLQNNAEAILFDEDSDLKFTENQKLKFRENFQNDFYLQRITNQAQTNLNKNKRTIAQLEKQNETNEKEKSLYSKLSQQIKEDLKKAWDQEESKKSNEQSHTLIVTLKKLYFNIEQHQESYFHQTYN